jgi:hypothetical protein
MTLLERSPADLPGLPARFEHSIFPPGFTRAELKQLLANVRKTRRRLCRRGAPPVSGDAELRILIRNVAWLWREGRPLHAGRIRGGSYLKFLQLVVQRAGVRTSPLALKRLHEKYGKQAPADR